LGALENNFAFILLLFTTKKEFSTATRN